MNIQLNRLITQRIAAMFSGLLMLVGNMACDFIHEDLEPCPTGLYIDFKYDYNLQRADMFHDHVGSVTAYLFDEEGRFLLSKTESGEALREHSYRMRLDLEPGRYQYVAVAGQCPLKDQAALPGARFRVNEPAAGDSLSALGVALDHVALPERDTVPHLCQPLDTLWMGHSRHLVEVKADRETVDTVSLVRDTKQIQVVLRDLDRPERMDVADYDFHIYDRNAAICWDNGVDESVALRYTPYALWNTSDKPTDGTTAVGRMAHADFMTSRIIYHKRAEEDAILSITHRESGKEVVRINLADMLSRLRSSANIYRYTPQEFLDRGYDYRLVFFLKEGGWQYAEIEISVLSWAKRIQYEDFIF